MKLFIPNIGTKLKLIAPWQPLVKCERRNYSLFEAVGAEEIKQDPHVAQYSWRVSRWRYEDQHIVIPEGTVLSVDRVYIRQGGSDFCSITFVIDNSPEPRLRSKKLGGTAPRKVRFWTHLDDANQIEYEVA